jgi:hypothetical protein
LQATAAYDAAPSTRPPPDTAFEPGYAPGAASWETATDVLAIVTF